MQMDNDESPKMTNSIVAATPRQNSMQTAGASAMVQRTLGEVQVAVMMAKQFPRDKIEAKDKLLNDCCREGLAIVSMYSYSKGGTEITGPSIRLAEAAKNAWGNMQSGWRELTRSTINGVGVSEVEAFAWDTENNTRASVTFSVKHWRDTKKGGYAITEERDIYELCANQAARRERACILKMIDGDMIEEAIRQCQSTMQSKINITPERIASMVKMFADEYGISQEQIQKRIQRRVDAINGPLMVSLTKIYNSLKEGMSKPGDWFEPEENTEEKNEDEKKPKSGNDAVKKKLEKKAKEAGADPATGELPKDEPKKEEKVNTSADHVQKTDNSSPEITAAETHDKIATKFVQDCEKAGGISDLIFLSHNNRDFLAEMRQKNPPKHTYCAEAYNAKWLSYGGDPAKGIALD